MGTEERVERGSRQERTGGGAEEAEGVGPDAGEEVR